jgi:segregation and condensation protein B
VSEASTGVNEAAAEPTTANSPPDAAPSSAQTPEALHTEAPATDSAEAIAAPPPISITIPKDLPARVEAILLSAERAVPARKIGVALGLVRDIEDAADEAGSKAEAKPAPKSDEADATAASGDAAQKPAADAEAKPAKKRRPNKKTMSAEESALAAIADSVVTLNRDYERTGRSFRIEEVAGGYRVMTLAAYAPVVAAYQRSRQSTKLTRASIETLAIIAYRQPITRAELEAIRGVSCGEVLRSLMERRMVTIKGRAEEVGRPILYGTTKQFLDVFGLASIKDLPTIQELKIGG